MKQEHIAKYLSSIVPPSPGAMETTDGSMFKRLFQEEGSSNTPVDEKQPSAVALASHVKARLGSPSPCLSVNSPSEHDSTPEHSDTDLPSPSIVCVDCPNIDQMAVDVPVEVGSPEPSEPATLNIVTPGRVIRHVRSYEALAPQCSSPPTSYSPGSPMSTSPGSPATPLHEEDAQTRTPPSAGEDGNSPPEAMAVVMPRKANTLPSVNRMSFSGRPRSVVLDRVMGIEMGRPVDFSSSSSSMQKSEKSDLDTPTAETPRADKQASVEMSRDERPAEADTPAASIVQSHISHIESLRQSSKQEGEDGEDAQAAQLARSRSLSMIISRRKSGRAARRSVSDMTDLSPSQIRRATAAGEFARRSPQQPRSRGFSFHSPRSRRRDGSTHSPIAPVMSDSFVTYIPSFHQTSEERASFQSVLQRFRDMGQKEAVPVGTTET